MTRKRVVPAEETELGNALRAWCKCFGAQAVTVRELRIEANKCENDAQRELLRTLSKLVGASIPGPKLAGVLRRYSGEVINGLKLELYRKCGGGNSTGAWRVSTTFVPHTHEGAAE